MYVVIYKVPGLYYRPSLFTLTPNFNAHNTLSFSSVHCYWSKPHASTFNPTPSHTGSLTVLHTIYAAHHIAVSIIQHAKCKKQKPNNKQNWIIWIALWKWKTTKVSSNERIPNKRRNHIFDASKSNNNNLFHDFSFLASAIKT